MSDIQNHQAINIALQYGNNTFKQTIKNKTETKKYSTKLGMNYDKNLPLHV